MQIFGEWGGEAVYHTAEDCCAHGKCSWYCLKTAHYGINPIQEAERYKKKYGRRMKDEFFLILSGGRSERTLVLLLQLGAYIVQRGGNSMSKIHVTSYLSHWLEHSLRPHFKMYFNY
jgi:hypothetical protein